MTSSQIRGKTKLGALNSVPEVQEDCLCSRVPHAMCQSHQPAVRGCGLWQGQVVGRMFQFPQYQPERQFSNEPAFTVLQWLTVAAKKEALYVPVG